MTKLARAIEQSWWRKLRWQVIADAGGMCRSCHKYPAVQVHHWEYPRGRREQARDLLAVCDFCHMKFHGLVPANDNDDQGNLGFG